MQESLIGQSLPPGNFKLTDGTSIVSPEDFKGHWSLVYVYPKDDTPGCTIQACSYRDNLSKFSDIGVHIYGLSLDDENSHRAFTEKFDLNFPLIADPDHILADFLGSYGDQSWQGKTFKGLSRDTFLIDQNGVIRSVFRGVNPKDTVEKTYECVKELVSE